MLLGYPLLWSTTADAVGSPEQADRVHELLLTHNFFVGGAVNPRDAELTVSSAGDHVVFRGFKNFSTGGVVSDITVLEGVLEGTEDHRPNPRRRTSSTSCRHTATSLRTGGRPPNWSTEPDGRSTACTGGLEGTGHGGPA